MNLTRPSLGNPVAVAVGVLLVILFGVISITRLPVQLTPEVEEPEITITTNWRAAAPEEVEAEITEPQEDVLRGLPGMTKLVSESSRGQSELTITFAVGSDMQRALLEVLSRLNRVARYPDDAGEPVISSVGGDSRPIAWFIVKPLPGNERAISTYQDFIEDVVQTRFERVPGVARSEVFGGQRKEVRITFDPYMAASLGVELPVAARLAGGGKDVSGGFAEVGKRRYTIRFAGKYAIEDLSTLIIDWRDGRPVRLADVAEVELRHTDRRSFVVQNGEPSLAVNTRREQGVNVLQVMDGLRAAVEELREGPLKNADLTIRQVYDETGYIERSIRMLVTNMLLGIGLAISVLWWFLRRLRATLMVALAIPISLMFTFLMLHAAGRTLNVVSLAGLAFAVGMVLDAAIVVLENIVRLREGGAPAGRAAEEGTLQVWGALLASTATTIAIFMPVVFLANEAGQLFADLALAIAVAVAGSLVIAVTVLPTSSQQWLHDVHADDPHARWWRAITGGIMRITGTRGRRIAWITVLILAPLLVSALLIPSASYMPDGNRNLVFAFVLPPPGSNIETLEREMGDELAQHLQPHLDGEQQPAVEDYFFVVFGRGAFLGARAQDSARTGEVVQLLNSLLRSFPATIGIAFRASLFGGFGGGKIDLDIQGRDIEHLLTVAMAGYGLIQQHLPGSSVQPKPGLALDEPELRLIPDERRIAEAGWDRRTVASVVRAFGDGLYIGDYFDGEKRLEMILRSSSWEMPEELAAMPVKTPNAGVQTLGELVRVTRTAGPDKIRRIDRRRTVTLQISLPDNVALEEAMEILRSKVGPALTAMLPADGSLRYSGAAEKLDEALSSMGGAFLLAIAILYLLMSALFRSFRDSLLVLVVIPLATVGSILMLRLTDWLLGIVPPLFGYLPMSQPMDLLTMIGFVILLGLVVNNAILLVHQTRAAERDGLPRLEAVEQAVHRRLRPILMSTLTSIGGMLPLLVMPGAGTELYRGMAAVIVGGMGVSTIFTLILLPSLLRMGEQQASAAELDHLQSRF
ncbi:MAG: efflux RND transporter permease subunit [Pseudomonadota bacterium]|nr:efflux RND transporter permease subunit [Pseudomonadota bacterium]